jgi:hypothetical protein
VRGARPTLPRWVDIGLIPLANVVFALLVAGLIPSATHDQDAVGKRHHLLKLDRHQQDRGPGVAPLQQLPVDEFDGSYIDPASRMADQQYLRLAFQFTSDDQFLLVAAGEIS